VNDAAQTGNTDFNNFGKIDSANGNGAVCWEVGPPQVPNPVPPIWLAVTDGAFVETTYTTTSPVISFKTEGYTGTADLWYAVVGTGASAPASTDYIWLNGVAPGGPHQKTITVTSTQLSTGYDVYVVISKDGKASVPEIISTSNGAGHVEWGFAVSNTDLTGAITPPVNGYNPNTGFSKATSQYSAGGPVAWYVGLSSSSTPVSGNFAANTQYTAKITLNAGSGFTFNDMEAFSYTGATVTTSNNTGSSIIVAITFPSTGSSVPTQVSDFDLTPYVFLGSTHTMFYSTQYHPGGEVNWSDPLIASITLDAEPGYTFAGLAVNAFYHNNASSVTIEQNTSGQVILELVFVSPIIDLSPYITAPVDGGLYQSWNFQTNDWYCSSLIWSRDGNEIIWTEIPEILWASTYTATAILDTKAGFTFAGLTDSNFYYHGLDINMTYPGSSGVTLEITFPPGWQPRP
jgi:hypothetical protein